MAASNRGESFADNVAPMRGTVKRQHRKTRTHSLAHLKARRGAQSPTPASTLRGAGTPLSERGTTEPTETTGFQDAQLRALNDKRGEHERAPCERRKRDWSFVAFFPLASEKMEEREVMAQADKSQTGNIALCCVVCFGLS